MGTIRIESGSEYESKPPKGARITRKRTNTTIEKISNGFIITKNHSGRYSTGKGESDYSYFDYTEKAFSEENPVQIKLPDDNNFEEDSDLADSFPGTKDKD